MKIFLFFLITIPVFVSCTYDSEEELFSGRNTSCDTTNITYSAVIAPMLSTHCLSCHSNANAPSSGNNNRFEDYADVFARKTVMLSAIKHDGTVPPMPKGAAKLPDCLIRKFEAWVNRGAPQN